MIQFSRKLLLAAAGLFMLVPAMAQNGRKCGNFHLQQLLESNPVLKEKYVVDRSKMLQAAEQSVLRGAVSKSTGTTVTIPVIFHVVLNAAQLQQIGGTAGVAARCASQIAILNADYAGKNSDSASIYAPFKPLFGHSNVQFGLAHLAPDYSASPGYEIKIITTNGFDENSSNWAGDVKHSATGGLDAWNTHGYLNIWCFNFLNGSSASQTLGLTISYFTQSHYPGQFSPNEVGISVSYSAFGKRTAGNEYFTLLTNDQTHIPPVVDYADHGRTLTHEIGHFFELIHIWADDSGCPPLDPDDGVSDTPPQKDANYGWKTAPLLSCGSIVAPNGDMFMNYMDYTDDTVMHMFTAGQVNLINFLVTAGQESYDLTQHPHLLYPVGVPSVNEESQFTISPNPSTGLVHVSFTKVAEGLQHISVINTLGQVLFTAAGENKSDYHLDLSSLSKGIYFIQCRFEDGAVTRKIVLQ